MKKNILKIGVTIWMLFLGMISVDAAAYQITASTTYPIKGNNVKLTIKGSDVTGRFNITSSDSSIVSVSEDRAWIENNSYTITLHTLKAGSATITVTPNGVSDSNGNAVSLGAKSVRINVTLPREKSSDNNLKSLGIEGYEISPEFDKDVQAYSAIIPEGTEKINITAVASESHATVKGTGETEVSNGANTINVIVKSETGAEKIYTINVEVKDDNPIPVEIGNDTYTLIKLKEYLKIPDSYKEIFEETTAIINSVEVPAYSNSVANITLVGLKDSKGNVGLYKYEDGNYEKFNNMDTNELLLVPVPFESELKYKKVPIRMNGETLEVYKYNDDSDLVIINAKNLADGKTSLYLYDTITKSAIKFDEKFINNMNSTISNYTYLIYVFIGVFIIFLIIIICLLNSLRKKQKKMTKFLKKQEAKLEATKKLNDVVSEVQKITEEENQNVQIATPEIKEPVIPEENDSLEGLTTVLQTMNTENVEEYMVPVEPEENKSLEGLTTVLESLSEEQTSQAQEPLAPNENEKKSLEGLTTVIENMSEELAKEEHPAPLTKKELKALKKQEKRKAKEKKDVVIKEIQSGATPVVKVSEETEEVYNIFDDD